MTLPATQPENMAQKRQTVPMSPLPWSVLRTSANGWKGISIVDANGLAIAYLVMQPGRDNEMQNAKAIVAAVNNVALS